MDDFNYMIEVIPSSRLGQYLEAITVARKVRNIVLKELEKHRWSRNIEKDEEIDFGI